MQTKSKVKRNELLGILQKFLNILDKTGENFKYYLNLINSMNDQQLEVWLDDMMKDPDKFFTLHVLPFHNEPSLDEIIECADILKTLGNTLGHIEQRVVYPHLNRYGRVERFTEDNKEQLSKMSAEEQKQRVFHHTSPTTRFPVPTGYLHIKRLSQIVSKKTSYSTKDTTIRNALTNQITSDSKIARNTDAESFALITLNANNILKEFLGARADNRTKNATMLNTISRTGFVTQVELDAKGDPRDNATLNLTDIFFTGAGLKTDLVTDNLLFLNTYIKSGAKSLEKLKKNFDSNGELIKEEGVDIRELALAEFSMYLDTKFLQELYLQLKDTDDENAVTHVKEISEYHYLTLNSVCEKYPDIEDFSTMRTKVAKFIELVNDNF